MKKPYEPIVIGENTYRQAIHLDVFSQFTIVKKLMPALMTLQKGEEFSTNSIKAISSLSDEDTKYIFDKVLSVVQRKESEKLWTNIYTIEGGFQYEIDLYETLMLIAEVLKATLAPFFARLSTTEQVT